MALSLEAILAIVEALTPPPPTVSPQEFLEHIIQNNQIDTDLATAIQNASNDLSNAITTSNTQLTTAIQTSSTQLINYVDTRIDNLISSPSNKDLDELNGRSFFSYEFWYLMNISEIDGLEGKLNLFDTKLSQKISSILPGAGITLDFSDSQNPRIIGNNPPDYYNKTQTDVFIDSLNNLILNNYFNKDYTFANYYSREEINNLLDVNNLNNNPIDNLLSADSTVPLSANQGRVLKGYIDSINSLLNSDDINLDTLQEIVNFIKSNKDFIDNLILDTVSQSELGADTELVLNTDVIL